MKSNNNASHAQNLANANQLISKIPNFGERYNPSISALSYIELQKKYKDAVDANTAVSEAEVVLKNGVSARVTVFDRFDDTVTRSINALKISGAPTQTIEQALSLVRDLRGKRASDILTPEQLAAEKEKGNDIVQVTVHNASFEMKTDNFGKYVRLIASVPEYNPNEADITKEALNTKLTEFISVNKDLTTADATLANARQIRNEILYTPDSGLIDQLLAVKLYVKSVFGATSAQYKQISNIPLIHH